MNHFFKVPLQHSDMFIRSLDFNKGVIEYSIHTQDGGLLEPIKQSKFTESETKIEFDGRFIAFDYAQHIALTLQ